VATITKKDLIDRIVVETHEKRTAVKRTVQCFLDYIIDELRRGNRLEFRDFGVFEIRTRAPRVAFNPKTMEQVSVPTKKTVKFKVGRLMKLGIESRTETSVPDRQHLSSRRPRPESYGRETLTCH